MNKIYKFSNEFCENILRNLNENIKFIIQYDDDIVVNENNLTVVENQPTDADGWYVKYDSDYMTEIIKVLKDYFGGVGEITSVIQRLDNTKKSRPHYDSFEYTAILLLNENFLGGDLVIEEKKSNLKIGELIVLSSNEIHYVDKLIEGERYTLVNFLNLKKKEKKSFI